LYKWNRNAETWGLEKTGRFKKLHKQKTERERERGERTGIEEERERGGRESHQRGQHQVADSRN
jgi:flagellar biosynthesis/type III secretory pathway protein FliH